MLAALAGWARASAINIAAARWVFYSALTSVGLVTQVMLLTGNVLWLPCGITLALMVLGATFDLGKGVTDPI